MTLKSYIIWYQEMFSIEEGDVDCFLSYFLYKYFDENLIYNKTRYEYYMGYISGFEWYLTDNFYAYDSLTKMVKEILEVASLLESDYNNPRLDDIKKKFSIIYMCKDRYRDFINCEEVAIQKHISVVVDFYRRFSKRLTSMMENNKNATVITIMGP